MIEAFLMATACLKSLESLTQQLPCGDYGHPVVIKEEYEDVGNVLCLILCW